MQNHSTHKQPTKKQHKQRSMLSLGIFGLLCLFFLCLFTALGIWQVKRLAWKNDLIAHVEARVHLPPVVAPHKAEWDKISYDNDEYRPVTTSGEFDHDKEILVTAMSNDTTGYFVLTPLKTNDGTITFINRGFIPMDNKEQNTRQAGNPTGFVTINGLLRMSEGDGFFPRKNKPEQNIWYSRQLPAMAEKLGLSNVAPYFIDADKTANIGGLPIGGLTVIAFRNSHLSYAITWFVLAFGVLAAGIFLIIDERKRHS